MNEVKTIPLWAVPLKAALRILGYLTDAVLYTFIGLWLLDTAGWLPI